jgi:hypothetical protein
MVGLTAAPVVSTVTWLLFTLAAEFTQVRAVFVVRL